MALLWVAFMILAIQNHIIHTAAIAYYEKPYLIGVCYGTQATQGNDVPDMTSTISLVQKYGAKKIRIVGDYTVDMVMELATSGFFVTLEVLNVELRYVAESFDYAQTWFDSHAGAYLLSGLQLTNIIVGVKAIPGPDAQYILLAMSNLQKIINSKNLQVFIKITTLVDTSALKDTFPPSTGEFTDEAKNYMPGILSFLAFYNSPLMIAVYPYYYYSAGLITKEFATFGAHKAVFHDGEYGYWSMFDALVDAFFVAENKVGFSVRLIVGETGWPTAGNGQFTTPELAATYNQNFMHHITGGHGTPRNPSVYFDGYVYSLFDEADGVDRHFGLFYPNQQPVYNFHIPKSPWDQDINHP